MPIEFRCPQCSRLLRTPDESAGKQARCPQCGQIVPVPVAGGPSASEPFAAPPQNPFAEAAAPPQKTLESGEFNPYAAPKSFSGEPFAAKPGELAHRSIDLGAVLNAAWRIATEDFGQCAVMGLVYFGFLIGLMAVGMVFGVMQQAAAQQSPVLFGVVQFLSSLVNFLVQTWLGLAVVAWGVKMARTRRAEIGDLFSVGPYYLRGLGGALLLALALGAGAVVLIGVPVGIGAAIRSQEAMVIGAIVGGVLFLIIAMFVFFTLFLYTFFIVDRNAGVMEAFRLSAQYMQGNRISAFALMMLVGFAGAFVVLCTCYLGIIVYMPFFALVMAMIYLMATGQPHAGEQSPFKQV